MVLTFTGDLSITGSFVEKIENNEEIFSSKILTELNNSDYVIANLEGPITDINPKESTNVKFNSPKKSIDYLSARNLNVFNLANNHILDCKSNGLIDTIKTINHNNCKYFGAGNNLASATKTCVLQSEDIRIALVGLTVPSVNCKNETFKICTTKHLNILKKNISKLISNTDYIIINYHGGEEFTNYPSPTKRRFLKKISRIEGVDIVICHHSHTLQAYEKYRGKYIFYSLGNFIFDIPTHYPYKYTDKGFLLKFYFSKNKFHFDLVPFYSKKGNIKDLNKTDFNNYFDTLCDFNNYKQKWRAEAYRVLFRFNLIPQKENISIERSIPLQEKSLLQLIFSSKFYSKAISILLSNNYRTLYISAIIHKLKLNNKFFQLLFNR
ncbi:CapA family protein [Lutibacter citreus]|uniref:CapA family protein n=1 Tax=Lutibacter citreus TaxID=2138210 RepID=UPI000DBE781E|nr:CapA family protein [Lutibacter citreus]